MKYIIFFIFSMHTLMGQNISRKEVAANQEKVCKSVIAFLSSNKINDAIKSFDTLQVANCRVLLAQIAKELKKIEGRAYSLGVPYFINGDVKYSFAFCDLKEVKKVYFEIDFLYVESDRTYKIIGLKFKDQEKIKKEKENLKNDKNAPFAMPPGN
ncbi:MAG: hypothetical protein JST26_17595 [Bacteroidetes bacterium]|nr:hypothetical protein [Bacteroidota bacterium]